MKLTHKQNEVAQLVLDGLQNKEIADRMKITEKAVKFHITNLYRMAEVKKRFDFIGKYINNRTFEE